MKRLVLALMAVGMISLGFAANTADARPRGRVVIRGGGYGGWGGYRGYNRGYYRGYYGNGYRGYNNWNRGYYGNPGYYNGGYYNGYRGYGYGPYGGSGIYFRF
ncbi:hypothetical protein SH661x_003243 [Planctomicrobium sp. SH661]|uniref:hypothetical protein n=1 Tax=Planctomicrobium sp. SH661 TaxID=3448124 RepID=UPI003F5C52A1